MGQASDGALSPNPRYHQIMGRAAEIARALGSPVGGAEHLFLAMLRDGGWPMDALVPLVDLGHAEEAVLGILSSPGYSRPPAPRFPGRDGYVQIWGAGIARELGDSYLGAEHAFLAMIRMRETVPARALAGLADLNALEAAVLEAMPARAASGPPQGAVFLPARHELDAPLRRAIAAALPEGTTYGFNCAEGRTWMIIIHSDGCAGPDVTREVLDSALASLDRRGLDD